VLEGSWASNRTNRRECVNRVQLVLVKCPPLLDHFCQDGLVRLAIRITICRAVELAFDEHATVFSSISSRYSLSKSPIFLIRVSLDRLTFFLLVGLS
jgi:hypothetical protein